MQALFELLKDAAAPVAIVGGADWSPRAAHHFANFAFRYGIPVAAAFRRQDAICNTCQVYAGNLGYGPNPKLQQRSPRCRPDHRRRRRGSARRRPTATP